MDDDTANRIITGLLSATFEDRKRAYDELSKVSRNSLYGFAKRRFDRFERPPDPDDVVQEVFTKLWRYVVKDVKHEDFPESFHALQGSDRPAKALKNYLQYYVACSRGIELWRNAHPSLTPTDSEILRILAKQEPDDFRKYALFSLAKCASKGLPWMGEEALPGLCAATGLDEETLRDAQRVAMEQFPQLKKELTARAKFVPIDDDPESIRTPVVVHDVDEELDLASLAAKIPKLIQQLIATHFPSTKSKEHRLAHAVLEAKIVRRVPVLRDSEGKSLDVPRLVLELAAMDIDAKACKRGHARSVEAVTGCDACKDALSSCWRRVRKKLEKAAGEAANRDQPTLLDQFLVDVVVSELGLSIPEAGGGD